MITLLLAIFFFIYQGIGVKITNRKIIKYKRSFDLSAFQKIRDFAYSTNKDLFERYHNSALKLLRISMLCIVLFSLLGGNPTISPFLFRGALLLLIASTSPKQFKKEFKQGFINWGKRLLYAALGLGLIWIVDYFEETQYFDLIVAKTITSFKMATAHAGIPIPVFATALVFFLIFMIAFNIFSWLILRLSMIISFSLIKAYTKFCFLLNNKRPQVPAYLFFQVATLIITFSIEK